MTDAEILRALVTEGGCDPYYGYIAPMSTFDVQRKKDTDFDAARKVDAVAKALFDRAADAIEIISLENEQSARLLTKLQTADDRADALAEENTRLMALLGEIRADLLDEANRRLGTAWGDSCGRRVAMIDGTVWDADAFASGGPAALRKPDAAGGAHD